MASETDKTTIVGKWLKALGAEKYTKVFFDQGDKELEELTKDVIERLVGDKPLAAKLVASAAALNDLHPVNPQPVGGSGSGGIPPLPAGTTLDLTHTTFQFDNIPPFEIPAVLSVSDGGSEVVSPHSLKTEDWIVIAKNNNILRAYTLGDPPNERADPPTAKILALDYVVPEGADYLVDLHLESEVLHEVTYSSATASYVRAGFDEQSASLSIPYAAGSFEREHKEKEARASAHKTIYMFGSWHFPRAKLDLKKFTKASTRLTAEIEAAVNANNAAALTQVFDRYGWAVPEEVVIGGQLYLTHTEVCDGSVNETEVEQTISAAVSAKYKGVEASAGIGFGNASGTKVTAEQVNKSTSFRAKGGKATLASNPQQWPDTVNNPNNWAVIRVSNLAPITDWLEPALRARVEKLLPEMRMPAMQVPQDVPGENHSGPRAESDEFIYSIRTSRKNQTASRGDLQLVCGTSGSPSLDQSGAVGGSASFHSNPFSGNDIWIAGASICLPVPKGSHYSVSTSDGYRDQGLAASRFTKTETKLTFGKWQTLLDQKSFTGASKLATFTSGAQLIDGFIFCFVRAPSAADEDRGFVSCTVDGKILGAASVHNHRVDDARWGCWSPDACFCVPVPRHLSMSIDATAWGKLDIKAWYLASTSQDWKFGAPELYTVNSLHTAETDGFLNGVVTVREGNARGKLYLFCGRGPDRNRVIEYGRDGGYGVPPAMVAVHQTTHRAIPSASAMLPIRRGFGFYAAAEDLWADPGHRGATVEAYWTPLLPVV
jgi:hypothetical protein